ncbi:MAG TPA: hypothetical protein VFY05_10430, partial [Candidatus Angelobacter sp.]|nr:hypothetical protein [Candidatus Angelobacter sp.]
RRGGQSSSANQVRLFEMDARRWASLFRMADWLRSFFDWHVANECAISRNQKQHHAKKSFAEEWKIFLGRHGMQEYPD